MKRKRETRELPPVCGIAQLQAETIDKDERTVELTFYSGAPVFRFPLFDDPYELEFEVSKKAAKLDRLNGGAPLIDSHRTYAGVSGILGVVENAWLANGEARARVRFSRRDDVEPIWQDVLDGVVRNVSMGTYILELEEVTEKGADMKRFRATSWQPYELSLVSVPADPGARVLEAADAERRPCSIQFSAEATADAPKGGAMKLKVRLLADVEGLGVIGDIVEIEDSEFDEKLHSKDLEKPKAKPASLESNPKDDARTVDDAIERDNARRAQIQRLAEHFDRDQEWVDDHVRRGSTVMQAQRDAEKKRAEETPRVNGRISLGEQHDAAQVRMERLADGLASRATGKPAPDPAKPYSRHSFAEAAIEYLSTIGKGKGLHPIYDRARIFELALHTTSDYPLILNNVLNKIMLPAYMDQSPSYREIAQRRDFTDFRPHHFVKPGDFPVPKQVGQGGEYQYGTASENDETVSMLKYGRIYPLAIEALINDDMGAFAQIANDAAMAGVAFENDQFFALCILPAAGLGPNMSDAVAVYNSAHGNVGAAGALSLTLLSDIRAKMRKQTSKDGRKLQTVPSILLVSPDSETTAEQLVNPTNQFTGGSSTTSTFNPFAGRLRVVADANLTGTRLYALADPATKPQYIYGGLRGQVGPRTSVREGFNIDGVEFKLSLYFGCGPIEYRYGVTAAGA